MFCYFLFIIVTNSLSPRNPKKKKQIFSIRDFVCVFSISAFLVSPAKSQVKSHCFNLKNISIHSSNSAPILYGIFLSVIPNLSRISPVHITLIDVVPILIILYQTSMIPVNHTIFYVIPFSSALNQSLIAPNQCAALYIEPLALIIDKTSIFPINCSIFDIIPNIVVDAFST